MAIAIFIIYLIVITVPGILLIYASHKFKTKLHQKSGVWLLVGAVLILLHLILTTGNYLVASIGDAQTLADFALVNTWIEGGLKYLGLVFLAIGLLVHIRIE